MWSLAYHLEGEKVIMESRGKEAPEWEMGWGGKMEGTESGRYASISSCLSTEHVLYGEMSTPNDESNSVKHTPLEYTYFPTDPGLYLFIRQYNASVVVYICHVNVGAGRRTTMNLRPPSPSSVWNHTV